MKLTIERATFLKALAHVQSVVERRNTIPILANVLLDGQSGALTLSATDMDLAINETVPADVAQEGATTAPAHTLYDIVRKLPDGAQVEIETDASAGQLLIRAGRSKFNLATLPVEDFPTMSGGDMPQTFTLEAEDLRTLIDRTRFAVSTEETRYYLNGIFLHAADQDGAEVLRAVATDGHRLARVQLPMPDGGDGLPGVIVPRKAIGELRKLIEETTDPIEIALSETRIRTTFDDAVLTSKLIDGTFPDYERVIPKDNDKVLSVDRGAFAQAVDRVSTISSEKSRAIKLAVAPGQLTLSATSVENGSAIEELEVSYDETEIEIGFNSRYLLDITAQIESAVAEFILADASSPTIVRDGGDESALYVLMPMRV
ncbi:MAG: DNA polymerase III subunit beta [Alphaproteobacteria bacterium]|nr:DNA polymerase III subunit beta [Alphaproteobacteria bacterium]|tara:strand:- start:415 stop:1533 length:1119 start_codon:yes stop_codon:yes gene_type:complete